MRKGRNGSGLIEEKEQKANKSEYIEKREENKLYINKRKSIGCAPSAFKIIKNIFFSNCGEHFF
jgi:hypothetical protein